MKIRSIGQYFCCGSPFLDVAAFASTVRLYMYGFRICQCHHVVRTLYIIALSIHYVEMCNWQKLDGNIFLKPIFYSFFRQFRWKRAVIKSNPHKRNQTGNPLQM